MLLKEVINVFPNFLKFKLGLAYSRIVAKQIFRYMLLFYLIWPEKLDASETKELLTCIAFFYHLSYYYYYFTNYIIKGHGL